MLMKMERHWPGKTSEWVNGDGDGDVDIRIVIAKKVLNLMNEEILDVAKNDDPWLHRLSRLDNLEERRADQWIQQAENLPIEEEVNTRKEDVEAEDGDAFEGRRRIRERWLQREQEEETLIPEAEEETEYETDWEEEQTGILMVKPVFVPKAERDTIAEREQLEAKERDHEELTKRRVEKRKLETQQQIVIEEIQKSEQIHRNMELEAYITDVDTDDDEVNEIKEHKTREIERIKRDKEARKVKIKKEEIKKLRNMTEEERREWERKNPKPAPPPKKKRRFMQKDYHQGAFFQDKYI